MKQRKNKHALFGLAAVCALCLYACTPIAGSEANDSPATSVVERTTPHTPTPSPNVAPTATYIAVEGEQTGQVTAVIDGDTVEVVIDGQEYRVRYIGVNTPERDQPCGPVATEANQSLVLGQTVRLVKDKSETDRYGRLLRYVYLNNLFVNAELVRLGYAEAVGYRPDTAQADYLESLEAQARAANLNCHATGVFNDAATPPPLPTQPAGGYRCPDGSACVKGNINSQGDKIYHHPGCGNYDDVAINESAGERFFAASAEAEAAGWRRAKNCP